MFATDTSRNIAAIAAASAGIGAMFLIDPTGAPLRAMHFLDTRYQVLQEQAVFITGIVTVIALEVALLGYHASSLSRLLRPSRSTWIDLVCFVLGELGLFGALTFIFSAGLASSLPKLLAAATPHGALAFANPLLQFVWIFVATDFVRYCMHFCQHKLRFWWEAHKFHHCATELNVITTGRAHPLDHAFQLLFSAVPTALLGGSMIQFLLLNIVLAMHAGLTHSMLDWNFGWVGRWLVVSPIAHRIHHSDMPEHRDKNLGSVFIFWDRIFGSYYAGPVINDHVGVEDNVYNQRSLVTDFVDCAVRVYATIVAVPRRLLPSR